METDVYLTRKRAPMADARHSMKTFNKHLEKKHLVSYNMHRRISTGFLVIVVDGCLSSIHCMHHDSSRSLDALVFYDPSDR
jgi:hypothetical protein